VDRISRSLSVAIVRSAICTDSREMNLRKGSNARLDWSADLGPG
jgi:hypothetical protein